ncbi:MAG: hypothetical protein NDI61_01480 [Bdellovibrionaceae bacterium]|nr:hypothetical protein [Pseudobdellovibrionaceae bacterium]
MKLKIGLASLVFLAFAAVGVAKAVLSSDGLRFFSAAKFFSKERNPAALKRVFDYSSFEGEPLKIRSLKRLVEGAQVVAKEGAVGIGLGHFVTKGTDGRGELACEFYGRMTLKFEGEGIMEFGEKPMMIIEAPCQVSADINRIDTVWIPFARLLADNKSPARFLETSFPDQAGVHFKFENMTSEWPRQWRLVSIRLFDEANPGREVAIDKTSLAEFADKAVVVTF